MTLLYPITDPQDKVKHDPEVHCDPRYAVWDKPHVFAGHVRLERRWLRHMWVPSGMDRMTLSCVYCRVTRSRLMESR